MFYHLTARLLRTAPYLITTFLGRDWSKFKFWTWRLLFKSFADSHLHDLSIMLWRIASQHKVNSSTQPSNFALSTPSQVESKPTPDLFACIDILPAHFPQRWTAIYSNDIACWRHTLTFNVNNCPISVQQLINTAAEPESHCIWELGVDQFIFHLFWVILTSRQWASKKKFKLELWK